jgi:hypothetical protein
MSNKSPRRFWLTALFSSIAAAIIAACKSAPKTDAPESSKPAETAAPGAVTGPVLGTKGSARKSSASNPRDYRQDGASHLYGLNAERIYKGKLPPLLYAIGVIDVHINRSGIVSHIEWRRAPAQAPEVMAEIISLIEHASPFPAPDRMGRVIYTDTWLWHSSGKFQLDTLTEGQN